MPKSKESQNPCSATLCLFHQSGECGLAVFIETQGDPRSHNRWTKAEWRDIVNRTKAVMNYCIDKKQAQKAIKKTKPIFVKA